MFGIILLSVVTLMHIYVFGRAASVPAVKLLIPFKYLLVVGLILWLLFFASRTLRHGQAGTAAVGLEFLGMAWMGALFLLFICLLAVDLVTFFGLLFPRLSPSLRGLALAAGFTFSLLALAQGIRAPEVENYIISPAGLSSRMNGKVIVALSDMHLGTQLGKSWLAARVEQVQTMEPDMVVLLGDILDAHDGALSELLPILRRLQAPMGVWAVLGNHEFYRGADKCARFLEEAGATVLRNQWVEAQPGLVLAGVDDLTAGRRFGMGGDPLGKTLAGRPAEATTVLFSHTPWQAERAASAGVDLMLSGHTHAGQIWPFGYLVGRVYPLLHGLYDINGMKAIVCRGTGTWGPRMRLWQPGEILHITLRAPSAKTGAD